jgi:undecaprenyl-diphosphatase
VVLIVFRREVFKILRAVVRLDFKSEGGKLAVYVILGSIPTALIGFIFKDLFESFFNNLWAVGVAFIITGGFLFISERVKNQNKPLNHLDAVLIGIAQGIAIIPGISRSGITITTGLLRRIGKQAVFAFSFLLFIPAVLGAAFLTAVEAENLIVANVDYVSMILGLATTVVVGYFSLKLLLKIVLRERFHLFAYYCWAIGFIVLLIQVLAPV